MTTSTSSANANALSDRRHFLSTLTAAGALGMTAMPAIAQEIGPIEALWPEHLRLEAVYDQACERTWDAEERYDEPERPRWNPFRDEGSHTLEIVDHEKKTCRCYLNDSEENIAHLKQLIAKEHEPDDDPDIYYQHEGRAQRAKKTLAEIEKWQDQMRRRKDAAGLTEAEAAEATARDAANARREAILAVEATTFRELAFQAAILDLDWQHIHAIRVLDRLMELAGVTSYGLLPA